MTKQSLITVTLTSASGLSPDDVVNTFAIAHDDPIDVGSSGIGLAVAHAYNVGMGAGAIGPFIGPSVSRAVGGAKVDVFDISDHLDGSPHGSPIESDAFTIPAFVTGGQLNPEEVCLKVTLRADSWRDTPVEAADGPDAGTLRDRPLQRLTGGVYIGPIGFGPVLVAGHIRPSAAAQTLLLDFAQDLKNQLAAGVQEYRLCVWSRANVALAPVTDVFVDDAFDSQRRRGPKPSGRLIRAI